MMAPVQGMPHPLQQIARPEHKPTNRIKKRPRRRKTATQTMAFTEKFIRVDAVGFFVRRIETTLRSWLWLLDQTTLLSHAPLAPTDVTTAVDSLERVIKNSGEAELPARFGYFRLSVFFDLLENRIRQEMLSGLILSSSGRVAATIALDYYLYSLPAPPNTSVRDRLQDLKREGRRWAEVSRPSAFLLLVYTVWQRDLCKYLHTSFPPGCMLRVR
jgi:hypothetical protein